MKVHAFCLKITKAHLCEWRQSVFNTTLIHGVRAIFACLLLFRARKINRTDVGNARKTGKADQNNIHFRRTKMEHGAVTATVQHIIGSSI